MIRSDEERIKKIISTWEALKGQISEKDLDADKILENEYDQWAVTTPLYNIGEHAYNISNELKEKYPEIPWKLVAGLRNRLVHDYEGINWNIIVEVIFGEMEDFVKKISEIPKEDYQ